MLLVATALRTTAVVLRLRSSNTVVVGGSSYCTAADSAQHQYFFGALSDEIGGSAG